LPKPYGEVESGNTKPSIDKIEKKNLKIKKGRG
jgi:hypothetical protein